MTVSEIFSKTLQLTNLVAKNINSTPKQTTVECSLLTFEEWFSNWIDSCSEQCSLGTVRSFFSTHTHKHTHTVKLIDDKYCHLLHFSTSFYIKKSSIKKFSELTFFRTYIFLSSLFSAKNTEPWAPLPSRWWSLKVKKCAYGQKGCISRQIIAEIIPYNPPWRFITAVTTLLQNRINYAN